MSLAPETEKLLYPASLPYNSGHLPVDDPHTIYYDEYGNKNGIPVVYLHGGPGFGASPYFHRFFDPAAFRIVVYDQRGAPRTRRPGETRHNSPEHLVADNEKLRLHLGIDKWHVYGGSWGSALSLLYAIKHAKSVSSLTLRGVWTMRETELDWYFRGVRAIMPDAYEEWQGALPKAEQGDLRKAYYKRIMDEDPAIHEPAASAFFRYVMRAGTIAAPLDPPHATPPETELAIMRVAMHFIHNHFPNDLVWKDIAKIRHIPTAIVQGRYDALTPPVTAFEISQEFDDCSLEIVTAGHSAVDPEIVRGLVGATNRIRDAGSPVNRFLQTHRMAG